MLFSQSLINADIFFEQHKYQNLIQSKEYESFYVGS